MMHNMDFLGATFQQKQHNRLLNITAYICFKQIDLLFSLTNN